MKESASEEFWSQGRQSQQQQPSIFDPDYSDPTLYLCFAIKCRKRHRDIVASRIDKWNPMPAD